MATSCSLIAQWRALVQNGYASHAPSGDHATSSVRPQSLRSMTVQRAGVDVADHHLVAVIGDRHPRAARCGAHRDDAADVPWQRARLAIANTSTRSSPRLIADGDDRRAVGEPLPVPVAPAVGDAVLAHRAFPQREREQLAARFDGEAVAGRMHLEAAEVLGRSDELARRLRPMRRHVDRRRALRVRVAGSNSQIVGAALIDDALAVGLRVARVEVVVIGVPPQVAAVGQARIQIAHAFRIGQVVDAVADPHRAGDVARELGHPAELAAARRVDPQVARGAAAIALPARRIRRVAADHLRVAGAERQVVDLAERHQLRHAARQVERVRAVVAEERLPVAS